MLAAMAQRLWRRLTGLTMILLVAIGTSRDGAWAQSAAQRELPAGGIVQGDLIAVADGDSFTLRAADGRVWQVRIAAIDAPERRQPWSDVARQRLRQRLQGREVRVQAGKFDPYGRIVGTVFVADEDVGLAQVVDGLAWHFRRYERDQKPIARARYARAEATARQSRRGLWHDPAPLPPWVFRSRMRAQGKQHQR
ncbi:MAG: thermonuclease family protein [Burkholderiaceae bacterium]|nr:thermonuclease family protein [Burkholderiaceae bacterium]